MSLACIENEALLKQVGEIKGGPSSIAMLVGTNVSNTVGAKPKPKSNELRADGSKEFYHLAGEHRRHVATAEERYVRDAGFVPE